jgi:hypothetical protein
MPFKICRCNQVKDLDRALLAGDSWETGKPLPERETSAKLPKN